MHASTRIDMVWHLFLICHFDICHFLLQKRSNYRRPVQQPLKQRSLCKPRSN